jgi:DNA-binding LacI/PurR family transcriptional regulator
MVQVLEHLIHLGHQQIAFVCGSLEFLQSKERLDAYKSALKLFGMKYDPSLTIEWASESAAHPLDVLRTILDREHPPTGIITHNDTFALKLLKSLWTLRISVPQEISLVGFENASSMSVVIPTITSVDVRLKEMGREAGKILISALETGSDPGKNVVLQPKLVVRESTGVAPTAGPSVHDNR